MTARPEDAGQTSRSLESPCRPISHCRGAVTIMKGPCENKRSELYSRYPVRHRWYKICVRVPYRLSEAVGTYVCIRTLHCPNVQRRRFTFGVLLWSSQGHQTLSFCIQDNTICPQGSSSRLRTPNGTIELSQCRSHKHHETSKIHAPIDKGKHRCRNQSSIKKCQCFIQKRGSLRRSSQRTSPKLGLWQKQ
jgi:hypothetical protein